MSPYSAAAAVLGDLGQTMRDERMRRGMTLREVCDAIGYSPSSLLKVEQGEQSPRCDVVIRMLDWLAK